jgi:hypothetical protein
MKHQKVAEIAAVQIYTRTHTRAHIYTHTCTHTRTYTYITHSLSGSASDNLADNTHRHHPPRRAATLTWSLFRGLVGAPEVLAQLVFPIEGPITFSGRTAMHSRGDVDGSDMAHQVHLSTEET